MKITNKEEHLENFNMIMKTVKDYLQQNFENKSIIDNFENFFDIDKIIKKDNVTLLNLAKLLLLMTSLSSKKEKLLPLLTSIDSNFQSEYILSCEFVQIKSAGMLLKNNFANNDSNIQVSEISFFLSGGDFLHKKIEILDETIIKNSEMYNSILNKLEKEMADLKQSKSDLENFNNEKAAQIKELKQKLDEELSQLIKKPLGAYKYDIFNGVFFIRINVSHNISLLSFLKPTYLGITPLLLLDTIPHQYEFKKC